MSILVFFRIFFCLYPTLSFLYVLYPPNRDGNGVGLGRGSPHPAPAPHFGTRPRPRAGTGISHPSPVDYPVKPGQRTRFRPGPRPDLKLLLKKKNLTKQVLKYKQ